MMMEPKTATESEGAAVGRSVSIFAYSFLSFAPLWENSGGLAIIFYYFTAPPIDRRTDLLRGNIERRSNKSASGAGGKTGHYF